MLAKISLVFGTFALSSAAVAQGNYYTGWTPGSEITGQRMQVQTNGIMNTVDFQPNGQARIYSASGATSVDATWTAINNQLCLRTSTTYDCYPYQRPFVAGQTVDLISNCAVHSRWMTPQVTILPGERG